MNNNDFQLKYCPPTKKEKAYLFINLKAQLTKQGNHKPGIWVNQWQDQKKNLKKLMELT